MGSELLAQSDKAPKGNAQIPNINGDVIKGHGTKNVYNIVNRKPANTEENEVLSVDKYLNVHKDITISTGNVFIQLPVSELENGVLPFDRYISIPGGDRILYLKLVDGKLKISAEVDDFEGKYLVRIRDNKLILAKNYHRYVSDRCFVIYDDYYIPVLHIELVKAENTIFINGVFNYEEGINFFSKIEFSQEYFKKKKFLMSTQEKDSCAGLIRETARAIMPFNE